MNGRLQPASCLCSNGIMSDGKRVLSVDYGQKNIGLAYSDELGLTVQPLPSIPNSGNKDFVKKLRELVPRMDIGEIVLGIPLNMNGTRGEAVLRMEQLLEALKRTLDIPIIGFDERLSTVEALDLWKELSSRRQKKYRTVDSLAAALILERYLKEK
jgi:putative holliday junction resolvase